MATNDEVEHATNDDVEPSGDDVDTNPDIVAADSAAD